MTPISLVCSDLHMSDNPRDAYRFAFLEEKLPHLIKQHKVTEVLLLGDLTEQKDYHGAKLVNRIVNGLDQVAHLAKLTILMGNHDGAEPDSPFFEFLHRVPNITFISKPTRIEAAMYLPHSRDPKRDWKGLNFDGIKIIFAHQTFAGAVGSFGRKLEGADLRWLPDVRIISGDVHVPQSFENLTYVGSPLTIDFGDDYEGRVLLIEGASRKSIKIRLPQKWLIRVDDLAQLPRGQFSASDLVRVEVPIKRADYAHWDSVKRLVAAWCADDRLQLESAVPLIVDKKTKPKSKREIHDAIPDHEILAEYAKLNGIDERTLAVGQELLT